MIVDANILLYAVDSESPFHRPSHDWLVTALNGERRVGLPWQSLTAFLRIITSPRATARPLTTAEAWAFIDEWLDAPAIWTPQPGRSHRDILKGLVHQLDLRANLISDAVLAALCVEHGVAIVSADSDFARFREIQWINPTVG